MEQSIKSDSTGRKVSKGGAQNSWRKKGQEVEEKAKSIALSFVH